MKIVSWNVNGLRALAGKNLKEALEFLNPDIICLQETKAEPETVTEIFSEFPDYQVVANIGEKKGYSGTAIIYKNKPVSITSGPEHELLGVEGRIQCADYGDFYLVNVYVPNSGQGLTRLDYRESWDTAFHKYLSDLQREKPLILCGDLNVAHRPIDLKNDKSNYNKTPGYTQVEIDGLDRLLRQGLIDIYRYQYPDLETYTYWSYRFKARERNIGWRIDYFLISEHFKNKTVSALVYPHIQGSDHCPIGLEIRD
ncbi:MAG: hypothetical protein RLZZ241_277 [Bacteroidota bacterium]